MLIEKKNVDQISERSYEQVVMYYTPGHLCPGCVVHHYSQFYGKFFGTKRLHNLSEPKRAPSSGSMDIAIGQSNLTKLVNIKKGIRWAARDGEL